MPQELRQSDGHNGAVIGIDLGGTKLYGTVVWCAATPWQPARSAICCRVSSSWGSAMRGLGKLEQAWQTDLLERPQETLEVKDNRVEVLVRGGVSLRLNWRWKVDNEK